MNSEMKGKHIAGLRAVVYNRAEGRCEVTHGTRRCNKLLGEHWQLAHMVARGKLERAAKREGLDPFKTAWQPCVVLASCPECNDAALVGRGLLEQEIIDMAIDSARDT